VDVGSQTIVANTIKGERVKSSDLATPIIEMRDITKSFSGVVVLDHVDLTFGTVS
jgi:hypothetical protein